MLIGSRFLGSPMRRGVHGATDTDPGGEIRQFGRSSVHTGVCLSALLLTFFLSVSDTDEPPNYRIHRI